MESDPHPKLDGGSYPSNVHQAVHCKIQKLKTSHPHNCYAEVDPTRQMPLTTKKSQSAQQLCGRNIINFIVLRTGDLHT